MTTRLSILIDGQTMSETVESGDIQFFNGLTDVARDHFLAVAEQIIFPPGVIFREGMRHDRMYVIESGLIQLSMHVPGRGAIPILSIGPGELLAWSAALGTPEPLMTATAVATEVTSARSVRRADLERLCEAEPEIGLVIWKQISRSLSKRLVATRLQLLDLFAEPGSSIGATVPDSVTGSRQTVDATHSHSGQDHAE